MGLKDHIQHGLDKAKQTVTKASESVNRGTNKRLPNTGTMTPVGQTASPAESMPADEVEADPMAPTEGESSVAPEPQAAEQAEAPPPGPPMAQGGPTNP